MLGVLLFDDCGGVAQNRANGRIQRRALAVVKRGRTPQRTQPRLPQNLIRVCVAHAGDKRLVAKDVLDLSAVFAQASGERRKVQVGVARVGAEVCEGWDVCFWPACEVYASHHGGIEKTHLVSARQPQGETRRRKRRSSATAICEPAAEHGVDDELLVALRESEEQKLAPAPHVAQDPAAQCFSEILRRVADDKGTRGIQDHFAYGLAGQVASQRLAQQLELGKLRQLEQPAIFAVERQVGDSCMVTLKV